MRRIERSINRLLILPMSGPFRTSRSAHDAAAVELSRRAIFTAFDQDQSGGPARRHTANLQM